MAEIVPYINEQQEIMKNAHYIRQFGYYWPFYLPDEVFIRISSFEPDILDRYWISNYGKIYDENIGGLMKPIIQSTGYWAISLQRKKEYYTNHSHNKVFPFGPTPPPTQNGQDHKAYKAPLRHNSTGPPHSSVEATHKSRWH